MTNVTIPDHMLEQVMTFMASLDVREESRVPSDEKRQECLTDKSLDDRTSTVTDEEFEVKKILDARETKTGWKFKILYKDGTIDWVNDKYCNCEQEISKFLSKQKISTNYLVCRVSTKEQASGNSTSLKAQELTLLESTKNFERRDRNKVFNIKGSAYKSIPKELKKIGNAASKGDAIWVWRVDRLSRNIVHYLNWLEELNNRGVEIYAHSEKITYRTSKLAFIQAIVDAQKESAAIGDRVKLSYKRKRDRGDERVGALPYGKRYRKIMNDNIIVRKVVENHPAEMEILNFIRQSDETPFIISEILNTQGKLKRNRPWTERLVRRCK